MKTSYRILPHFLLLGFLTACECEDLTPTDIDELRETFQPSSFSSLYDDGYTIRINFNMPVDSSSLILGDNLILVSTVSGEPFLWGSSNRLNITYPQNRCNNNPPCNEKISVTIKGDGGSPLRSNNGSILDGDRDFTPGGDFTETFFF